MLPDLIGMLYKGYQNIKGGRNGIRYALFERDICLDTRRVVLFTNVLLFKKWKSHLRLPTGFATFY
jgi:hypothetical protein